MRAFICLAPPQMAIDERNGVVALQTEENKKPAYNAFPLEFKIYVQDNTS